MLFSFNINGHQHLLSDAPMLVVLETSKKTLKYFSFSLNTQFICHRNIWKRFDKNQKQNKKEKN